MLSKLLVPLDWSSLSEQALGQAAAIARAAGTEVELTLVHKAMPGDAFATARSIEDRLSEEAYLRTLARDLATGAAVPVQYAVVDGAPADAICARAREVRADLIVMTSHGHTGVRRVWSGSVADGVMRHATVPVLMLRSSKTKAAKRAAHHLFKRIVVLVDGSPSASRILGPAAALARCAGGRITLLRVVQPLMSVVLEPMSPFVAPGGPDDPATRAQVIDLVRDLTAIANVLAADEHVEVNGQVLIGQDIAKTALDFIRGARADLIGMTTSGRGASRLVVGSVVDRIVRGSELPLLVLCARDADHDRQNVPMPASNTQLFALA